MCGRMNISDHRGIQKLLEHLGISLEPDTFPSRYNVAPGASVQAAFYSGEFVLGETGWGIIPHWAKPGQFSRPLINARSETIWEKPSFRHLVKASRAIIPVNGFYEWQRTKSGKQPYHFRPVQDAAFALAGIYQANKDGTLQVCVITTHANDVMAPVHDRMPVILGWNDMKSWLMDNDRLSLDALMQPISPEFIEATPVSGYVSNAKNEGAMCIEAV